MYVKSIFKRFSTNIHRYLFENLQRRKLLPLKQIQSDTFSAILSQKNVFLNSCTGSGKTLSYLVPVLNSLLSEKRQENRSHGALILTLNKELASQIYREIRLIDIANRLSVYRAGPVSHLSPVIEALSNVKSIEDQMRIEQLMHANIANIIKWSKTDIFISTPQLLNNILTTSKNQKIQPKFVVIDEADLLLEIDQNVSMHTDKILNLFSRNNNIRYILTASSFPSKMGSTRRPSEEVLARRFAPLQFVRGQDRHKLPSRIELFYIELEQHPQKSKNDFLKNIVAQRLPRKIIVFCMKSETVRQVAKFLKESLDINAIEYYAGLNATDRSQALYRFTHQDSILVSTDLGSRGLDFLKSIQTVIEYDMAENIINFLNRAGRTGRNGLPGQIITFVQPKNKQFFHHLQNLQQNNQQFDELFSRKRSYKKLFKNN